MIFINGVAFEKVGSQIWIVSCTAPLHRTYTIVSAERQYLCSTYFAATLLQWQDTKLLARMRTACARGCPAAVAVSQTA
jgi:hypothetical protein